MMWGVRVDLIIPPIEPLTEAIVPAQFGRMPDGVPATQLRYRYSLAGQSGAGYQAVI